MSYVLAGYRGRVHGYPPQGTRDFLWYATDADLDEDAEVVAYRLRALIASGESALFEAPDEAPRRVEVVNVEVSADHHEAGGGAKTVNVRLRLMPEE
jgi:hypothetical protein